MDELPNSSNDINKQNVMEKPQPCSICLNQIHPAYRALLPCSHQFCDTCIISWTKTKLTCPNCKAECLSAEFHINGKVESIAFAEPEKPSNPEVDLTGLDTHYIASEAGRLLDNVKLAQKSLFVPGGVFSRTSRYGDGGAGQLAARVETRLTHVIEDLRQEARFDPNQLMQELMRLDFVLRSLWAGQVLPMYEDDEGDEEYDDYFDYDEEDEYEEKNSGRSHHSRRVPAKSRSKAAQPKAPKR